MRYPDILLSLLILVSVTFSCKTNNKNHEEITTNNEYRIQILNQLRVIDTNSTWIKSVNNQEVKSFKIANPVNIENIEQTEKVISPESEVASFIKIFYSDPKIIDYYTVNKSEDVIVAELKPEFKDKTKLIKQIIKKNPNNGKIIYFESHLNTSTWIYNSQIIGKIFFDNTGTYQSHTLVYSNDSALPGVNYHTEISGKIKKER